MTNHRLLNSRALILAPLTLLLFIAVACGGTAGTPVIVEKEVVKEVIKEVPIIQEVIKEVAVTATPAQQRHRKCFPNMAGSST